MKTLCIYHAHCADGLGAAWAVHRALGPNVDFKPASYGSMIDSNRVRARDILIVDFSYPLATLRAIAAEARSVLVLDHHKTAQEDLAGLLPPIRFDQWSAPGGLSGRLNAIFDMDRSGAGITWDYLHPNPSDTQIAQIRAMVRRKWDVDPDVIQPDHVSKEIEEKVQALPRPRIIDLIEDRDLWGHGAGPSEEAQAFHAVLLSHWTGDLAKIFKLMDIWADQPVKLPDGSTVPVSGWLDIAIAEGRAILRAHHAQVTAAVRATRRTMRIAGYVVPVANVSHDMASEAGHLLCQSAFTLQSHEETPAVLSDGSPIRVRGGTVYPMFSASYYDGADGRRHFSRAALLSAPPQFFHIVKRDAWKTIRREFDVARPDPFDALAASTAGSWHPDTYLAEFATRARALETLISLINIDLAHLQHRWEAWEDAA